MEGVLAMGDNEVMDIPMEEESEEEGEEERVLICRKQLNWVESLSNNVYSFTAEAYSQPDLPGWYDLEAFVEFRPGFGQTILGVDNVDRIIHTYHSRQGNVGRLVGRVLDRPAGGSFLELAADLSEDFGYMAALFCDHFGRCNRVRHPELLRQPKNDRISGGFLHIQEVEVHSDHSGKDLGMQLIHLTLDMLSQERQDDTDRREPPRWTLAVATPAPLGLDYEYYADAEEGRSMKKYWYRPSAMDDDEEDTGDTDGVSYNEAVEKIALQFFRLGFLQADKTLNECPEWFITRDMFLRSRRPLDYPVEVDPSGNSLTIRSSSLNPTGTKWMTKPEGTARMDLFIAPESRRQRKIDEMTEKCLEDQLRAVCKQVDEYRASLSELCSIVAEAEVVLQQASAIDPALLASFSNGNERDAQQTIHESCNAVSLSVEAIMENNWSQTKSGLREAIGMIVRDMCAQGASLDKAFLACISKSAKVQDELIVLEALVAIGANVNFQHDDGWTPLHEAARSMRHCVIAYLLSVGADPGSLDTYRKPPIFHLLTTFQYERERTNAKGADTTREDVQCMLDSARSLMSQQQRNDLIDGYFPPRLAHRLANVAEMQARRLEELDGMVTLNVRLDDEDAVWSKIDYYRLCYVPPEEVDFDYEPKQEYWIRFIAAYKVFWTTAAVLLRNGRAPTVDNMACELRTRHSASVARGYEQLKGVDIQHMIYALFDIAKNTWEYGQDEYMKSLPEHPFDEQYDLLWLICMYQLATWQDDYIVGPFEHDWRGRIRELRTEMYTETS